MTQWTKPGGEGIEGHEVRRYYERNDLPIFTSKRITCPICKGFLGWEDQDDPIKRCTRSHDQIPLTKIQEARK